MFVVMSSGFQVPERFGLAEGDSSYNPTAEDKQTEAETNSAAHRLRFRSLTLDELSEELDRQTKETQKLQEGVENATKATLKRFCCTYSLPGQCCHNHDSAEDSPTFSAHHQRMTQPMVCNLDTLQPMVVHRDRSSSEKATLGNAIDNCLQQLSDLQFSKIHDPAEQDTFNPRRAIMNLQTKLHELQKEKDVLSDLRLKDSRKRVDQMATMLCMLEELQNIKSSTDQKHQETENETLELHGKVESLERSIKEVYQMLCEMQYGNTSISSCAGISQTHVETGKLQKKSISSKGHQESEEYKGVNNPERMEDLITSLGQEMAMLTDKLTSSTDSSLSLSVTLELLKKLAENQTSLHQRQISELESTISSYRDKVCCLQKKILEAETQLFSTQREREQSLQQAKDLQSQLGRLKTCCEQQQLELSEDAQVLRGQLEVAGKQLCKAGEEKTCLQALLEQKSQEVRKFQELLQEKEEEFCFRLQQTQQHLLSLEDAQSQCQTLQAEQETLRLKLKDKEEITDVLRLQMESSIQMTEQHRHTIDSLQREKSLLINQLNQHKLEAQQLRAELVQHKLNLASVEHERRQLQASVTEQSQCVREETLEKQQVTAQLELQCVQFINLTKEHKELQRLHSCKDDEHEGVVLKLQSQLNSAHDEIDKIRHTLRTLEGVDRNGLQVALDMQKEITARREQVDSLQGKIQHLEEKVEKMQQEKRYQNLETHRHLQELTFVREEKRQLAKELKVLRSKDQQLRERISELEAILHRMSESFASCQDFLQVREQEYFCLKLQHALDLKEIQGQNLCTVQPVPPPDLDSKTPSPQPAPPSTQHAYNTQIKSKKQRECSTCELRSLVRQLRGVISEKHGPHSDENVSGCSLHRRRSAPETERRTTLTDNIEQVKACTRSRRRTCGSEPHFLTAELNKQIINSSEGRFISTPVSATKYTSLPQILSLGRKSPVHTLLTSDPVI